MQEACPWQWGLCYPRGLNLCRRPVLGIGVFVICVAFLCAGGLSLAVEGPSKTEIKCVDNQDGTCTVSYLPTVPGEYLITVKFADNNIMGSPFTAKVTRQFTLSVVYLFC